MKTPARVLWLSSLVGTIASAPELGHAESTEYGASASVRAEGDLGAQELGSARAAAQPGVLGEPARALLDAPGAARGSFLGSELILWGGAPGETRTYVDGVEIPRLFHPAGLRTTVHPALIERVAITPGALPVAYGRSLGGAVELTTVDVAPGLRAHGRADAIDGSLSAEGGSERVRALVGARYGYFDRVVAALAPASQDIVAVPSHADGVARLALRTTPDTRLTATWIGTRDQVDLAADQARQRRSYTSHIASLSLERRYGDAARVRVTPFAGFSSSREQSLFAGVPLASSNRGAWFGLRADYTRSLFPVTLKLGLDVRGVREQLLRRGTLSLPAREGDVRVFGQVPVDEVDRDTFRATNLNVAPWVSLAWRIGPLSVVPSFRLETYLLSVERSLPPTPFVPALGHDALFVFAEPRLTATYRARSWLRLEARSGLSHQAPESADLSATFGSPTLSPARAVQTAVGARLALPHAISLEVIGFHKALRALAVRTEDTPAHTAQELQSSGHGRARGGSIVLRRELFRDLFFTVSYTLSRSQRSDVRGQLRPLDYDQTHGMSSLIGYTHGDLVLSLRARVASGSPRTAVIGRYLDLKTGRTEPQFGVHNGSRLPTYFALDAHLEVGLTMRPLRWSLFADVLNATNHENVEEHGYTANYASRRDVTSIPIVAMAGLSVRYGDE